MRNFIEESVTGKMSDYCDDSDPALNIAKEIKERAGKGRLNWDIVRFKFVIISNSILSKQVKNISREDFLDRPVVLNIWTLERFSKHTRLILLRLLNLIQRSLDVTVYNA